MFDQLKFHWRTLRGSRPGERFHRYHEARRSRREERPLMRALTLVAGVALLAVGLVMLVAPGPGILVALVGAGLLAGESRGVARTLDRTEVGLRRFWRRLRGGAASGGTR